MTAPAGEAPPLSLFAERLADMAARVADEAETAASAIRALSDQAHQVASLAAALDMAASELSENVGLHGATLAAARNDMADHRPAVEALARSPDHLSTISRSIQEIGRQSHMLALNARIEAARGGAETQSFAAVAAEMSDLAGRTRRATGDIGRSAEVIAQEVQAARAVVLSQDGLMADQAALLGSALDSAQRQRGTASALSELAAEGAGRVDAAASAIGRVGAAAVAVKLLAREIARRAQ